MAAPADVENEIRDFGVCGNATCKFEGIGTVQIWASEDTRGAVFICDVCDSGTELYRDYRF